MLKLFGYELKKLFGIKAISIIILILLAINVALAVGQAKDTNAKMPLYGNAAADFYVYYEANTAEVEEYYAELQKYAAEQKKLEKEMKKTGDTFVETRPAVYADGIYTQDMLLIEYVRADMESVKDFGDETRRIIKNAQTNYKEYIYQGYSDSDYVCKYQLRSEALYTRVLNETALDFEFVRGWQDYFSFDITGVLLLLSSIAIASFAFIYEKDTGVLPTVRAARRGRVHIGAAKLGAVMAAVTLVSLLFCLCNLAVFGVLEGYSSLTNDIQVLPSFRRSWLIIDVWQYIGLHFILRTLGAWVMTFIALVLSLVFYNYVLTYISALAVIGAGFWLYSSSALAPQSIWRHINVVSVVGGSRPFERYYGLNVFSAVVGYLHAIVGVCLTLIMVAVIVSLFLWSVGVQASRRGKVSVLIWSLIEKLTSSIKKVIKPRQTKLGQRTISLVGIEMYKTLISSRLIIVAIILVLAGGAVFLSSAQIQNAHFYTDTLYETYIGEVEGEWTQQKHEHLVSLAAEQSAIIAMHDEMVQKYRNKQISAKEYVEHNKLYSHARTRLSVLNDLIAHSEYLEQKQEQTGLSMQFVYNTGWEVMLDRSTDWCLYAILIILFVGIFTQEFGRRRFADILRATKHGRTRTFMSKLLTALVVGAAVCLITQAVPIVATAVTYRLPCPDAPLCSIQTYKDFTGDIGILEYVILHTLVRLAAAEILAVTVLCASAVIKRNIPVMATVAGVTLIPAICVYFGFTYADKINFLNLFEAQPLLLVSASAAWMNYDLALFAAVLVAVIAFVIVLTVTAWASWSKSRSV